MNNIGKGKVLNFINIFLVVSYNYLRMLGMNNKKVLFIYIFILSFFALLKISKIKFAKEELEKIGLFVGLIMFSSIIVGEVDLLIVTIMAITFLKDNSKSIVKNFLLSSVIWYTSIILLYMLGFLENNELIRVSDNMVMKRNSLGFSHVNQVFLYFLPIQLCFYLLYCNKKFMVNSIIFVSATILFLFSNCRTGYISTIIFLIVYNIPVIVNNKIFEKTIKWLFLGFTILSILIALKYGDNGANKINEILSLRPYYLNRYIEENNITNIVGGRFKEELPLDNIYVYLLQEKGIVIYLAYLLIAIYSTEIFKKSTKYKTIIFIYLIYGLFEGYIFLPAINFVIIIQIKNIILKEKEKIFIEEEENNERKNFNNSSDI